MPKKTQFRPTVQALENRQLMAADIGLGDVSATTEEPTPVATITDTTISGNTANMDGGGTRDTVNVDTESVAGYSADVTGGGLWNADGFNGGVRVAAEDVEGDATMNIVTGPGAGGGPHVRVFDATPTEPAQATDGTSNTIMNGEEHVHTDPESNPTDAFFAEFGRG